MGTISTNTSIYLSQSAQTQLKTLMSANEVNLGRLNAKKNENTSKNNTLNGLQSQIDTVQADLANLAKTTDLTAQKTAIDKFTTDYNSLMTKLNALTGKGATFSNVSEIRGVKGVLRTPFGDSSLYSDFQAAGLTTNATGLSANTASLTTALSSTQLSSLADSFNSAVQKLEDATNRYETSLTSMAAKLDKDITREQKYVDTKNARTQANFLKMYQAMQEYTAAQNGTSGASAILAGLG